MMISRQFYLIIWLLACIGVTHMDAVPLQNTYAVTSNWGTGYNASVTIQNTTNTTIESWTTSFQLLTNQTIAALWNAESTVTGSQVVVKNTVWNGKILPGQQVSFGMTINNPSKGATQLLNLTTNGNIPSPNNGGNGSAQTLDASYRVDNAWSTGFQISISLTNKTNTPTSSWVVAFDLPQQNLSINSLWGGTYTLNQGHVIVNNHTWNGTINPGETVVIGAVIIGGNVQPQILNLSAQSNVSSPTPPPPPPPVIPVPMAPVLEPISNPSGVDSYVVSWRASAYANSYTLQQDLSPNFSNPQTVYQGTGLQQSFSGQLPGTYYYRVSASNESGTSNASSVQSVTVQGMVDLQAPSLSSIIVNQDNSFLTKWTPVQNAVGYLIEESLNSNFASAYTIWSGSATEHLIVNKAPGTYYYRVRATNANQISPASNIQPVVIVASVPPPPQPPTNPGNMKIISYYPNWAIYRNPAFKPEHINGNLVTHIHYAFVNHDVSGNLILFDPWADVQYRDEWTSPDRPYWGNFYKLNVQLKQQYPHIKASASIGGWTLSNNFSAMAANPQARTNFVQNCIKFCDQYGFDGIDLDWEYPGFPEHNGRPEDTVNFTLLMQELSAAAKAHNPQLLVSFAAPAGEWHYKNIELEKVEKYCDYICLMGYDLHGPWGGDMDKVTNHHSGLYPTQTGDPRLTIDSVVKAYLQKVPASKLVLGMPLYGRVFGNVNGTPTGLFSPYSGPGRGTMVQEPGLRFFSDIKNNLVPSYQQHWDDLAKVPYLYSPNFQEFVTYDNEASLRLKCQYLKKMALGGAMTWDISMDVYPTFDGMSTINDELKKP